ncbi:MAG: hypothetical protein JWO36_2739 [Myxococcales bacterium]|nr:hypothetical protein [Myxococcales bacterium]
MPEKRVIEKAKRELREGKSPKTAAGEFVREEIEHIRKGKHGARSAKQAVAIGLSKARQAGIPIPPKSGGKPQAARPHRKSPKRSRAVERALQREPRSAASHEALSKFAKQAAKQRKRRR